jgi:OOP family OmpA-OmpF porin
MKTKLVIAVAAAVGMLGMNSAMAHKAGNANVGHVGNASGHVVTDAAGNCIRNSAWTEANKNEDCGGAKAAAPAPAKAPAAAPGKISLKADSNFDFDSAELKAGEKKELDDLAAKLKGATVDSITVTGHTDNVGADAYNQSLSERRAASVKNYLVGKGANASKIKTSGKGESQPVADNKTADGRAKNRRVDIEVTAAK